MNTPQEFHALLQAFRQLEDKGFAGGAAMATLTRTLGSTFRRPGARMLVCGDGTVVRGLSGGCPEADMIMRSHEVIADGKARIVRYDRESGLDALLELGCGGQLEVLIEPLRQAEDLRFAYVIEQCLARRQSGFIATAFAIGRAAISPRPRRLVWNGEILLNELDDGDLTRAIIDRQASDPAMAGKTFAMTLESAQGPMDVLIESLQPAHAVLLIGISAVSFALARIGRQLGWEVTVVDHRDDRQHPAMAEAGVKVVAAMPERLLQQCPVDAQTVAVVMTHNLERDIDYLRALLPMPLAYVGAIGSRQRAGRIIDACGDLSSRLRVPAGLDIGAETPEEIALAIAAEIVAALNGRGGSGLSGNRGPMH